VGGCDDAREEWSFDSWKLWKRTADGGEFKWTVDSGQWTVDGEFEWAVDGGRWTIYRRQWTVDGALDQNG
jgi:hypothetical protein